MKDPSIRITVKFSDGREVPPGTRIECPEIVRSIIYQAALAGFPAYRRELDQKKEVNPT